ncbi:MAG: hypothetical protein ACI4JJ_02580 [Huintestinicola sp.]
MAKAHRNPRAVKGAVLIMVLTVMTVLIIMLAGAMTIVSTASNRAQFKYEETQAYYTARSALDVVTDQLFYDNVTVDGETPGASTLKVSETNPSQSNVLYQAIVGELDKSGGTVKYDTSKSLKALYTDTWNTATQSYDSARVPDAELKDTYMEFAVTDPTSTGLTTSDSGTFANADDGAIIIKVQLVHLIYDTGETTADGEWGQSRNSISTSGTQETQDLSKGDASRGYLAECLINVSSTAVCGDNSSRVSRMINPLKEKNKDLPNGGDSINGDNATYLGNVTYGESRKPDSGVPGNGNSKATVTWRNSAILNGETLVNSNVKVDVDKKGLLKADEALVINGDYRAQQKFTITGDEATSETNRNAAYMMVNGTVYIQNDPLVVGGDSGRSYDKIDLIVTNLKADNPEAQLNNLIRVKGNLYVDGVIDVRKRCNDTNTLVDGDIFISDRRELIFQDNLGNPLDTHGAGNFAGNDYDNTKKSNMGMQYTVTQSASRIITSYLDTYAIYNITANPDPNNDFIARMLSNANSFAKGNIYYYYKETMVGTTLHIEGCSELEAFRRWLINLKESDPLNFQYDTVLSKLTPCSNDNLKYVIQLGASDRSNAATFIEGIKPVVVNSSTGTVKLEIEDNASYKIIASLPTGSAATARTKYEDCIKIPTNLGNISPYVSKNTDEGEGLPLPSEEPNIFLNEYQTAKLGDIKYYRPSQTCDVSLDEAINQFKSFPGDQTLAVAETESFDSAVGKIALIYLIPSRSSNIYQNGYMEGGKQSYDYHKCYETISSILNEVYNFDQRDDTNAEGDGGRNYKLVSPVVRAKQLGVKYDRDATSVGQALDGDYDILRFSPTDFNNGTVREIDTSTNPAVVILSPGHYSGRIEVTGPNRAFIMIQNPNSNGIETEYQFEKFSIWYKELYDSISSTSQYYVMNDATFTPPTGAKQITAPPIYIFIDKGVNIYQSNNQTTLNAYIYGPNADMKAYTPCAVNKNICYEGTNYSSVSMDIIGGIYVRDLELQNACGLIYVSPSSSSVSAGSSPIKTWRTYKFSNEDIVEDPNYSYSYDR